jgi:hypothetical protein
MACYPKPPNKNCRGSILFTAQLVNVGKSTSDISTFLLYLSICKSFSLCSSSCPNSYARIISLWKIDLYKSRSILAFSRPSLSKSYSAFSTRTLSLSSANLIDVSLILSAHSSNSFLSDSREPSLAARSSQS